MCLTVAQVARDLITDGRDAREHHGRVVDELHENRIELERMRRQVARSPGAGLAGARPRRLRSQPARRRQGAKRA